MIGVSVGQYECLRLLGEGGTGMVYLAVHRVLNTPRAVKVLRAEWTRYPELVERFVNEARAAAAIRHRNIIGVHDCGQLDSGERYILLDYLEGGTLARFLQSHGGPLAPHDAVHVLAEVANGLQAAHDHHIVHRDLKPDNIYLTSRDGDPRAATILDFGVAKLVERSGATHSSSGGLWGTPVYMAPEQLRGERVGPEADVFALGVIAYQMMSGGPLPYQRDEDRHEYLRLSPVELYERIKGGPVDLRRHNPQLAPAWIAAIGEALEPDPARRLQTPRQLALRLAEATPGDGFLPSGISMVQTYARELLEVGTSAATVRAEIRSAGGDGGRGGGGAGGVRYQTLRKIGAGGMGEVFEGMLLGAEGFMRPIAIKRVHAEKYAQLHFDAMFIDEARLASQLIHPNLVEVLDFDRDPEGRPFLVMEYVDGQDLAALLRRGAVPAAVAIFIASEMLHGLGYAHELPQRDGKRGLIHRDLSPHNVLLSRQGAVKVSDFGIAKALESRGGGVQSHELSGKPAYMSPEQVHAQPLDARSDLFSVGIILWEMLVGQRLFVGSTGTEVMASVKFKRIAPPSQLRRGAPPALDAVVAKLLERDRERRYASAREVIADLLACAEAPRDGRGALQLLLAERAHGPVAVKAAGTEGKTETGTQADGAESADGADGADGAEGGDVSGEQAIARATARAATMPQPFERRRRWRWRWSALLGPTAVAGGLVAALMTAVLDSAGQSLTEPIASLPAMTASDSTAALAAAAAAEAQARMMKRLEPKRTSAAAGDARASSGEAASGRGEAASGRGEQAASGAAHGTLIVAVRPWAAVSIDGRRYGETPVHIKLPAGRHRVQLVNQRASRTVTVSIGVSRSTLLEQEL